MKFSPKKKAKIRKCNERRIAKNCKHMIGYTVDYELGFSVIDQAKIKDTFYLLAQNEAGEFALYKIVKVYEYVRLSKKRVLENQAALSNHNNWYNHSTISFTTDGEIESVKRTVKQFTRKDGRFIHFYIIVDY